LLLAGVSAGFVAIKRRGSIWRVGEIILMSFVVINVLWYLKTPGWYRYFFPSHLVLLILFPAALMKCAPRKIATGILILLFFVQFGYLLTKRHDPLYLSGGAARVAAYIDREAPKESAVFAINTPSAVFLLDAERTWQYLQINSVLHFGQGSLHQADGTLFPYVVTNGSVEGVAIIGLSDLLQTKYTVAWEGEHYIVYHRL
jgi:hypothetical protein